MLTGLADEHTTSSYVVDDLRSRLLVRSAPVAIAHHVQPKEQAAAADVANALVLALQFLEPAFDHLAHPRRVADQILAFEYFEHRQRRRTGNRIAPERVEVHLPQPVRIEYLASRDEACHWVASGHGFAEGDDVRHDAARLVSPPRPGPAETRLHLVCDQQATSLTH